SKAKKGGTTSSSLSFERFARIQKAVSRFIREKEEEAMSAKLARETIRAQAGGESDGKMEEEEEEEVAGVLQGELVTWYLSSQDITSEAQLSREKQMICSVIDKLLQDKILSVVELEDDEEEEGGDDNMQVEEEGKEAETGSESKKRKKRTKKLSPEEEDVKKQQRYLTVHPNYAFE
ncbi:hypothetical protein BBJ28_00023866, partial [Nothophytophthora sp. Chile5]